jgi:hypothetical protein
MISIGDKKTYRHIVRMGLALLIPVRGDFAHLERKSESGRAMSRLRGGVSPLADALMHQKPGITIGNRGTEWRYTIQAPRRAGRFLAIFT